MDKPAISPVLGILLGIVAVSFGSILVRLADAPALVISAYRLTLASLILAPFAWWQVRDELRQLGRRDFQLAVLSGVFLAAHFATWISSLSYTSVASSVALVDTHPLFVAIFSYLLLGERASSRTLLGILVAAGGGAVLGYGDLGTGQQELLGDFLALVGAAMAAVYFLIGRNLRRKVSLLAYIFVTYSSAALILILLCLVARLPFTGYSQGTYAALLLLALVPQILGHSSFNWALRYLSATFVSVTVLGEPIGATLLAILILSEVPPPIRVAGVALILVGIYLASQGERANLSPSPSSTRGGGSELPLPLPGRESGG
jgi:drug/metabolite transporter (DMT)-like permease